MKKKSEPNDLLSTFESLMKDFQDFLNLCEKHILPISQHSGKSKSSIITNQSDKIVAASPSISSSSDETSTAPLSSPTSLRQLVETESNETSMNITQSDETLPVTSTAPASSSTSSLGQDERNESNETLMNITQSDETITVTSTAAPSSSSTSSGQSVEADKNANPMEEEISTASSSSSSSSSLEEVEIDDSNTTPTITTQQPSSSLRTFPLAIKWADNNCYLMAVLNFFAYFDQVLIIDN